VLTFTAVSILLRGTSKTKFTRTKIEVGAHHGKIGIKPKIETFEQRIVLLNPVFHMVRAVQGQVVQLDPGTHAFPFRFTLPSRLPPSVNPSYGCRIRYQQSKALVERPELGHMLRVPSRGLSIHLKTVDKLGSCIPRAAAPRCSFACRASQCRHLLPMFLLNRAMRRYGRSRFPSSGSERLRFQTLKTAWQQQQVACAAIVASVSDACRAPEFNLSCTKHMAR